MAIVEELDGLLEQDGDEQADDDRRDVQQESAPGVHRLVRRVNFVHGLWLLLGGAGYNGICGLGRWHLFFERLAAVLPNFPSRQCTTRKRTFRTYRVGNGNDGSRGVRSFGTAVLVDHPVLSTRSQSILFDGT
jgi:hypothetical protein